MIKKLFRITLLLLYIALLVLMLLPWVPVVMASWPLDNLANFQPLWVLAAVPVMLFMWVAHYRHFGLFLLPIILLVMLNFADRIWPTQEPQQGPGQFRLVQFNAFYWNANMPEAVQQLNNSNADIIALQEVSYKMLKPLEKLEEKYPYSVVGRFANKHLVGLNLYSRYPIVNYTLHTAKVNRSAFLEVELALPGEQGQLQVFVVHPNSPRKESWWDNRNRLLMKVASLVNQSDARHLLVVGDMNVSPWSPWFRHFVQASELEPCAELGTLPTWSALNTEGHWRWLVGSDIDHCFFRPDGLAPHRRRTIEAIGSDHQAVATDFEVYSQHGQVKPNPLFNPEQAVSRLAQHLIP